MRATAQRCNKEAMNTTGKYEYTYTINVSFTDYFLNVCMPVEWPLDISSIYDQTPLESASTGRTASAWFSLTKQVPVLAIQEVLGYH